MNKKSDNTFWVSLAVLALVGILTFWGFVFYTVGHFVIKFW